MCYAVFMDGDAQRKPTYEELEARVEFVEKENAELRAMITKLAARIEELEKKLAEKQPPVKPDPPPFVKPNIKKRHKKPGRRQGHKGCSRMKPPDADEEINLAISHCPDCGGPLGSPCGVREHVQEDIVPAKKKVTAYRRYRYWCPHCRKQVEAPPAEGEIPNARIGPVAVAWSVMLKQSLGVPFEKTARLLEDLCGLRVSPGALALAAQRVAQKLAPEVAFLRETIRGSPAVNVDETGWRVGGRNNWMWAFVTDRLTLYRIAPSRAGRIAAEELGKDFGGVVVADFFSAYNKLSGEQQKCTVHLLRELRDCAKKNKTTEFAAFRKKLKRVIADAVRLAAREDFDPATCENIVWRLHDRVHALGVAEYKNPDCCRIAKRLRQHGGNLFTFLFHPGVVTPDNNRAERAIRPAVVIRKISGGSRTSNGANASADLMSLSRTCHLNDIDFVTFILKSLRHHLCGCQYPVLRDILVPRS
jgi:transposase